jgi:hypothetical protein
MKDVVLITAYCPSFKQENTLRNLIQSIDKELYDICIVSHLPLPISIQNGTKTNYFMHENDLGVLTSKGYIWSTNLFDRGILVIPELLNKEPNEKTLGVCSDYIEKYK